MVTTTILPDILPRYYDQAFNEDEQRRSKFCWRLLFKPGSWQKKSKQIITKQRQNRAVKHLRL